MKFDTLTFKRRQVQLYKYVCHKVAHAYGKSATFMPKPVFGDNGTGMHVHQSIWKETASRLRRRRVCRPVGNLPVLHRRHHQARQGPERLHQPVDQLLQASGPGLTKHRFCSPTRLATVRHPAASRSAVFAEGKRVEVRFPDPTANPYLASLPC
jgi:glutamine synthetase